MSNIVKKMLLVGAVWVGSAIVCDVNRAEAGWWHGYGCYAPYHSYSHYSTYSWGYSVHSCWSYPSYCYWSYPAYTSWYYPAYDCGWGYPAYYGYYWGSECCLPAVNVAPAAASQAPADAPKPAPDPNANAASFVNPVSKTTDSASGFVDVFVPADATVFVNGHLTKTTGEHRRYQLNDLVNGKEYPVEIRSEVTVDGKVVKQTQSIKLSAGTKMTVAFRAQESSESAAVLARN